MGTNVRLKACILETGHKQSRLAELMDIEETLLNRIICGKAKVTEDEKASICQVLGVSEDEVFSGNGS